MVTSSPYLLTVCKCYVQVQRGRPDAQSFFVDSLLKTVSTVCGVACTTRTTLFTACFPHAFNLVVCKIRTSCLYTNDFCPCVTLGTTTDNP